MNHRRRRLRVPAVFAGALWLFAGFANAAAMGTCAEHDHYGEDGSGHATGVVATHGSAAQAEHHGDHGHHGAEHEAHEHAAHQSAADNHAAHGHAAVGDDVHTEGSAADGACTCGAFRCVDSSGTAGLEVASVTVSIEDTSEPAFETPAHSDVRPTALIPHFLPPSNGPPSA